MSMSLDFNLLWSGANVVINGIGPTYLLVAGVSVGLVLVALIGAAVQRFRP